MGDKRQDKRIRRRLKVQYGETDFTSVGFTTDVSAGGLFIVGNVLPGLFRNVHVKVFLDQERVAFFEGTVRRHEQVPPNLRQIAKGGFGLRFTSPEELLLTSVRTADEFEIIYASQEELQRAYLAELKHGGVFVRTERTFPRDAKVFLSIACPYVSRQFEFEATVVHTCCVARHLTRVVASGLAQGVFPEALPVSPLCAERWNGRVAGVGDR